MRWTYLPFAGIRYDSKLYWHKMVDGKLVEFRSLR
nr:MAG TPA: hypothetical protein [Caudoviricetes sp.]